MSGTFDDQTVTIPCSKCGNQHQKTIGWIKANEEFTCPCGVLIHLDRSDLLQKLEEAERLIGTIPREIKFRF